MMKHLYLFLFPFFLPSLFHGQPFTRISDTSNPIVTDIPTGGYAGATWIDYDKDGWLDLFVNQDFLYRNTGLFNFERVDSSGITGVTNGLNNGNTWGDYNNDGYADLFLVNNGSNGLFKNNGDGTFSQITNGILGTNINAWSAAWGDYDNDGLLDLMATHPCGFIGPCQSNWLLNNADNDSFTNVTTTPISSGNAAYTVGSWSDFDQDGDQDLFVGSGEVSFQSLDHIYINQLAETGVADFVRRDTGTLFGDTRDGQNWNWIDYDNDGDLDGFVTNYLFSKANDFYRNDEGVFVPLSIFELGTGMTSTNGAWLTNVWADFDNDGDLDVFIVNDGGTDKFYVNDGDGTFTDSTTAFTINGSTRGATAGDYDNDGDMDLFVNGSNATLKGLYRNNGNDNNWIKFELEGTLSNRMGIGAKVRMKSTINGSAVWQMRELSSQNSFCGMNSPRIHFGLGDAKGVDSVAVEWPSGIVNYFTDLDTNQFLTLVEDTSTTTGIFQSIAPILSFEVYPNPARDVLFVKFDTENRIAGELVLRDLMGKEIRKMDLKGAESIQMEVGALAPGVYNLQWISEDGVGVRQVMIQ